MGKNYNAKYDTADVNGRDVIETGAIANGYDKGPNYADKKENAYHDDHGKHAILAGGEDKTGPAFGKNDAQVVRNDDHGKKRSFS